MPNGSNLRPLTRREVRENLPANQRLNYLDDDADHFQRLHDSMMAELKEIKEGMQSVTRRQWAQLVATGLFILGLAGNLLFFVVTQ